jgi:hypothetical protein
MCYPYRPKRNKDGGSPGEANHRLVTIKEGLNDDDFIPTIDTAHYGTEQGF